MKHPFINLEIYPIKKSSFSQWVLSRSEFDEDLFPKLFIDEELNLWSYDKKNRLKKIKLSKSKDNELFCQIRATNTPPSFIFPLFVDQKLLKESKGNE
jgi:hypothetical protein